MACCLSPILSIDACSPMERHFKELPALSIKQPFANLVVFGMKPFEIRSRRTNLRGRVLICSSLEPYKGTMFDPDRPGVLLDDPRQYIRRMGELALYGKALGMVDIVGCRPFMPEDAERAFVPHIPGAFVWELANPVEIEPFPVTGQLGFFKVPANKVKVKCGLSMC